MCVCVCVCVYVFYIQQQRLTSNDFSLVSLILPFKDVPLGAAAWNGHTETVQRLLEAGANVNHQNKVMLCHWRRKHKAPGLAPPYFSSVKHSACVGII